LKPPDRDQEEECLTGWKSIALAMGTSVKTVQRLADRLERGEQDPLPVWDYCGSVIAYPTALRDWRGRQKVAWNKARLLARRALADASSPIAEKKAG
jgi:hypothetical protein